MNVYIYDYDNFLAKFWKYFGFLKRREDFKGDVRGRARERVKSTQSVMKIKINE